MLLVADAQEEVTFMASIARCVAAGRAGALPTRVEPALEPSEDLVQKLMLVRQSMPASLILHVCVKQDSHLLGLE